MEHPTRVGKYEVEQFLGGGMSHVYRAKDSVLGRRVAVKILTEAGMNDPEAKARFLQEARMASNINHENIIAVYDFGEDQGRPFIVMEFLEGESLRDAIRNAHTGDVMNRLRLSVQVGRALDYIHGRKIIHRDIKPENIHLDQSGRVRLMDFGIAKSEGVQLTRAGFTLGTPYYMAPEQVLGRPLTPKADVYAFGVLMFELLTGQKPVSGDTIEKIFQQILYESINLAPLKALHVAPQVIEVIAACTAKQTSQRPSGLGVVCDILEHYLDPAKPGPKEPLVVPEEGATDPPLPPPPSSGAPPTARPPAAPVQRAAPAKASAPRPQAQGADDLPGFLAKLPAPLRSQGGLMVLAALAVVSLMVFFIAILWAAGLL